MSEREFWEELRTRINSCGELAAAGYCDWIEAKRYILGAPDARIEGLVGFVQPAAKRYAFAFMLPTHVQSLEALDWSSLLAKPKQRGWAEILDDLIAIDTREFKAE